MVKKLSKEVKEETREEYLLDYLIRVAKPVTRKEIKEAGFDGDRKTLRKLEREDLIKKVEQFANNTIKKDIAGNTLKGTRYYTYQAVK